VKMSGFSHEMGEGILASYGGSCLKFRLA
jgi:hypothetical protein